MAEQFSFFKNGLSDAAFVKYMGAVQDEVDTYFTQEWGDGGHADLLQSLSDLFTLTSSRCLLGEEIRQRWNASGMAEHYCKCVCVCVLLFCAPLFRASSCSSSNLCLTHKRRTRYFLYSHSLFLSQSAKSASHQMHPSASIV